MRLLCKGGVSDEAFLVLVASNLSCDGWDGLLNGAALCRQCWLSKVWGLSWCMGGAALFWWWWGVGDVALRRNIVFINPQAHRRSFMWIESSHIMLVLMQLRFNKMGGVTSTSQCNKDWWKCIHWRLLMLVVSILSDRMCPQCEM